MLRKLGNDIRSAIDLYYFLGGPAPRVIFKRIADAPLVWLASRLIIP